MKSNSAVGRFIPREWTGINGFAPLDLKMQEDFPKTMRVRARPINPRLYEVAHKEFQRLMCYMYKTLLSLWASPLVIAPKATKQFLRFRGDYRRTNEYIVMPQPVIPHVQHKIKKAMGYSIFLDIDMTNSFHLFQIR